MESELSSATPRWTTTSPPPGVRRPSEPWGGKKSAKLASTPDTNVSLSPRRTAPTWRRVTSATLSSWAARAASSGVNDALGSNSLVDRMMTLASMSLPMISSTVWRIDAAITEARVTRVTPIISAAAVAEVRRGVRMAFSCASLPGMRYSLANGQPITRAMGRANSGLRIDTPMKTTAAPTSCQVSKATPKTSLSVVVKSRFRLLMTSFSGS